MSKEKKEKEFCADLIHHGFCHCSVIARKNDQRKTSNLFIGTEIV